MAEPAHPVARWRRRIYHFALFATGQFVILTLLGMALYPGGTAGTPDAAGYNFFRNFFSDLGMYTAHNGAPNTASAALFLVALTTSGLAVALYFLTAPPLFRANRRAHWLALAGSLAGVLTGIGFIGVAWAPADVQMTLHVQAVLLAFRSFPVTALCYAAAILLTPGYPRRYAAAFGIFAILLVAYLWLLTAGPEAGSDTGLVLQATGQKIIVYATIACMAYQGLGALRLSAA
ncbi:MAG: hypothetical protein JXN59_01860 [Anaerolineae bacterium]|nr:hypothetical protein [Anaerolineae bacterium]